MPGIGLLHGIHGQRANRIDAKPVDPAAPNAITGGGVWHIVFADVGLGHETPPG
jgi:hypothetical protein